MPAVADTSTASEHKPRARSRTGGLASFRAVANAQAECASDAFAELRDLTANLRLLLRASGQDPALGRRLEDVSAFCAHAAQLAEQLRPAAHTSDGFAVFKFLEAALDGVNRALASPDPREFTAAMYQCWRQLGWAEGQALGAEKHQRAGKSGGERNKRKSTKALENALSSSADVAGSTLSDLAREFHMSERNVSYVKRRTRASSA